MSAGAGFGFVADDAVVLPGVADAPRAVADPGDIDLGFENQDAAEGEDGDVCASSSRDMLGQELKEHDTVVLSKYATGNALTVGCIVRLHPPQVQVAPLQVVRWDGAEPKEYVKFGPVRRRNTQQVVKVSLPAGTVVRL